MMAKTVLDRPAGPGTRRGRVVRTLGGCVAALGLSLAAPARAELVIVDPAGGTRDFGKVLVGQTATGGVTAMNDEPGLRRFDFGPPTPAPPFGQLDPTFYNDVPQDTPVTGTYTFTPQARGVANGSAMVGATSSDPVTVNLTGQGVAPVQSVGSTGAGLTRVGTGGTAVVNVTNVGDGNQSGLPGALSNLHGTAGAGSGAFALVGSGDIDLADGTGAAFQYSFTPTARGSDSANISVTFTNGNSDGTNSGQEVPVMLTGQGVGPEYSSTAAPGSTLDFGTVNPGQTSSLMLDITNITTDEGSLSETGLTLLGLSFSNTTFSAVGFTPGTVLAAGGNLLLTLEFSGLGTPGVNLGTLTVFTDQSAAFGGEGDSFVYDLMAFQNSVVAVPEPSTLALAGLAAACGLGRYRRRRRTD